MGIPVGLQEVSGRNQIVLGGASNKVKNSSFAINTNGWSISGTFSATSISGGVSLLGDGYLYQLLNSTDVVNGSGYILQVHVESIASGSFTANAGTSATDNSLGSVTLSAGWNSVRFTAGSATYINLKGSASSASCIVTQVNVFPQVDVLVTGDILDFESGASTIKLDDGSASAPSLSFASDTNTGIYRVGTDSIGIAVNGANAITVDSSGKLVLGGDANLYRSSANVLKTDDALVVAATTASSSTTTGALTVAGGAGIAGALYVGGNVLISKTDCQFALTNTTATTGKTWTIRSLNDGKLDILNGSSAQFIRVSATNNYVAIGNNADPSTNQGIDLFSDATTGASLGLRVQNNGAGRIVDFNNSSTTLVSISNTGILSLTATTASTSTTTGALTVAGGVGIAGALNVGGDIATVADTDYSSTSTIVGWGSPTKSIFYKKIGNFVVCDFAIDGTSDTTATEYTFTLPIASKRAGYTAVGYVTYSGTIQVGRVRQTAGGTTFYLSKNDLGTMNSGVATTFIGQLFYEAQ